ncbi:MAG TPA: hybrid sensor histidine kinase/response regulator [Xanthobacteraceae bacterium]|nr:hybrid sensor histidine kinase/response regulator [Xanthobacteraceae bacterium]
MDELLRDFLTETNESIDVVDVELVRFEHDPNNAKILDNIFRLVHTIKGTCGFLGLPRLEALTHAAEALMGNFRDGASVTSDAVTLILATIDRIKMLLDRLERNQAEEPGDDRDLIIQLSRLATAAHGGASEAAAPAVATLTRQTPADPVRSDRGLRDELASVLAAAADAPKSITPAGVGEGRDEDAGSRDDDRSNDKIATKSIRVHVDTLEHLMTMVSELVLTRNQLLEIVRRHEDSEFKVPLQRLSNVTAELQEGVMKTRMQQIGVAWQKLPRIVRDLSTELGKAIELELHGAETELDRQVLELIKDPLIHMVRNSADHGLEMPAVRRAAGKPEKGTIRLSARHEGGHIVIEISDDGAGLSTERIKAAAITRGLATEAQIEKMSEAQIQCFIFAPGFSTAQKVTSVSGRGVGMDVVRANIDAIGGTIDVKSVLGQGTRFGIKIPLTLAIVSALIVESAGDRFAIPQLAVVELVRVRNNSEHRIEHIKDAAVLRLRNKLLPLVHLKVLLKIDEGADCLAENGFIVVTQVGSQTFGIVVDAVFHTEEIVVKPMSSKLRHIPMFAGNTILGDGSVIMIIEPNGIAQSIGNVAIDRDGAAAEQEADRQDTDSGIESMLVFRAGSPQPRAVLLSLVTRLEEVDVRKIESANGRSLVQYRGQLMPLIPVNDDVRIKSTGKQPLLVFSDEGRSMALVVDEIVDIVEQRFDIELLSQRPGVLGSALVRGQATEVIDIGHYLPLAFDDWQDWRERRASTARHRVLLIDDSAFFRNMLAPLLNAAGYAVSSAASAPEALIMLRAGARVDIVITDIDMPGMDGFELTSAVRRDPRTALIPVIGLSSLVSPESVERGRQVGLHDYVAKFDRQGLIAALKEQTADMNRAA